MNRPTTWGASRSGREGIHWNVFSPEPRRRFPFFFVGTRREWRLATTRRWNSGNDRTVLRYNEKKQISSKMEFSIKKSARIVGSSRKTKPMQFRGSSLCNAKMRIFFEEKCNWIRNDGVNRPSRVLPSYAVSSRFKVESRPFFQQSNNLVERHFRENS